MRFIAIIRHVRFSNRSWLGSRVLVLLYSFHICVPNGSFRLISSGLSKPLSPAVAFSFHSENADPLSSSSASCRDKSSVSPWAEVRGVVEAVIVEVLAVRVAGRFKNDLSWSEKSEIADVVVDISGVHGYPTHCLCGMIIRLYWQGRGEREGALVDS